VGTFTVPVIFKIGLKDTADTYGAVEMMAEAGAFYVHINAGSTGPGSAGLEAIGQLKGKAQFLIAGGGIEDAEGAKRVLKAGADAVAVGTAAMKDAGLCGRIQKAIAGKS
jgi:heptaprenylglyceryl phosphate synthase